MRTSVVVPSRDRPGPLAACLAALAGQADEVVVVDDASIAPIAVDAPGVRVVRGTGRGPAAARNLGARTATGAVVLFTDDDCRPGPGWVAAMVAGLEEGADVVAGPTVVPAHLGAPARAAQVVTNHLLEASMLGTSVAFAPTSNLAARAELFELLPFDEAYPLAAGEDRDWCDRVTAIGNEITFVAGAVVGHHPDLSLRAFWRQQVRYGRGAHRFRSVGTRRRPPARFYLALLRKGFAQGPAVGGLVVLAQLATVVGVVGEGRAARRRSGPSD